MASSSYSSKGTLIGTVTQTAHFTTSQQCLTVAGRGTMCPGFRVSQSFCKNHQTWWGADAERTRLLTAQGVYVPSVTVRPVTEAHRGAEGKSPGE